MYIIFFIIYGVIKTQFPELFSEGYEQSSLIKLLKDDPLRLFVLAVIFAPIIEEMMFRTLIRPTHSDIILLLCSWPVFYLSPFIPADVHWVVKLLFIAIFLFTVHTILKQIIPLHRTEKIRAFLYKFDWLLLIISSIIFGLVHINNYVDNFIINATLIALIIPRIISGFMMGLLKMKNDNLIWPMALHALNNGFVITLLILAPSSSGSS